MENNISYCNFDCRKCNIYLATISEDIVQKKKVANRYNLDISEINCLGCKSNIINQMCINCNIRREKKNGTSK